MRTSESTGSRVDCYARMHLAEHSYWLRRRTIEASFGIPHHLGGSLSCIEILTALFHGVLKSAPDGEKDIFILSKGHAAIPYFHSLADIGELDPTFLNQGTNTDGIPVVHPCSARLPTLPFSTGSLGMGVSFAVGAACGLRLRKHSGRVFVLVGDGELQAGIVWEVLLSAARLQLNNFTVIVDNNRLQTDGLVSEIVPTIPGLVGFGAAIGFEVIECDGHDADLLAALLAKPAEYPRIVVANTVKGKGVSFMEDKVAWHSGKLEREDLQKALQEVDAAHQGYAQH